MRVNILRCVAVALGLGTCTIAQAQYGTPGQSAAERYNPANYSAPSAFGYTSTPSRPAPSAAVGTSAAHLSAAGAGQAAAPQQTQLANGYQLPPAAPRIARAQPAATYQSPAKWSHFNNPQAPGAGLFQPASSDGEQATGDQSAGAGLNQPIEQVPIPPAEVDSAGSNQIQNPNQAQRGTSRPNPIQASPIQPGPTQGQLRPYAQGELGSQGPYRGYQAPGVQPGVPAPLADQGIAAPGEPAHVSPYMEAMGGPWAGSEPCTACGGLAGAKLYPWFGGASLLFLSLENDSPERLAVHDSLSDRSYGYREFDPDSAVGFETSFGRYFGCGRYGLGVTYFNFNPDDEERIFTPGMPGDYHAAMPQWQRVSVDADGGGAGVADTVYNHYDGAAAYRFRRDIDFQGLELNLFSFGIMGAQRAGAGAGVGGFGHLLAKAKGRLTGNHGNGCSNGQCATPYGFGGACGPLIPAACSKVQIVTSHGFRWFQVEDSMEFAANIDGTGGYQSTDMFYNVDTDNNLYGYQFGSRVTYCLGHRFSLIAGGKVGIYGNNAEARQRLGTREIDAYYDSMPGTTVDHESERTVLATLSELDLGLGYCLSPAWSIRGGYRLIGLTGIATAPGEVSYDGEEPLSSDWIRADDSIILHGGYVGLDYNW